MRTAALILVFALFFMVPRTQAAHPGSDPTPSGSALQADDFQRQHAAYQLMTRWISAIELHGVNTNAFPSRLADLAASGLSLTDPWSRPLDYRLLEPGSYRIEILTPSGPLTYVRLAFTRVPATSLDSDKLAVFLHTTENLRRALEAQFVDENEYPERLQDLATRHFPAVWPLSTPWGMPVSYSRREAGAYILDASTPYGLLRIENGELKATPSSLFGGAIRR